MDNQNIPSLTNQNELPCKCCGAKLKFAPGTMNLKCEFCGTENAIEIDESKMEESREWHNYKRFIENLDSVEEVAEVHTVKCKCCGAETTFDQNVVSSKCDFCGSPIAVQQGTSKKLIKPQAVIPFCVDQRQAQELFRNWLKDLWFAPGDLKKVAQIDSGLTGMYIPYWDYKSYYAGNFRGERGDYYYTHEKVKDSQGNVSTRKVRHTRWTPTKGYIKSHTDEIFVPGSNSLPSNFLDDMGSWNLKKAVPVDEKFLSGFKAETYSIDLKKGFETNAKKKVKEKIEDDIVKEIGGDEQRISQNDVEITKTLFKHVLLPIWLSSFRYNGKSYRFVVNGENGTLRGDRPYSAFKIFLAVLAALAALSILFMMMSD